MKKLDEWDKELKRAATGSKEQVSQLGQDLIDMNYDDWTEGESYESLVKRYQGKGQKAMDDTIGQVAARTGGLASSYAAQAGQQAYGGWMENLENAARSLYDTERQELMDRYNIANDIYQQGVNEQRYFDERDYQRGRDAIADQKYATEWAHMLEQEEKEDNQKKIEDLEDEMYWSAYYGNGSWPQFKERAEALGLTKADYERAVHNANRAYDMDVYGAGNTQASIDATEELETRIKNGEDISTLTDLITLSGKPASWWAAYQSYEFSNKAEADEAEAEADEAEAEAKAIADVQMYIAAGTEISNIDANLIAKTGESAAWWETWKKANTVASAPEFRSVSAGDVEKYSTMVANLIDPKKNGGLTEIQIFEKAESLLNTISAATGNEDFAINLIYAVVPGLEEYLGKKYSQ